MTDKSLVVHLSDHGEEINFGHGLNYMSKAQYEVPMFIFDNVRKPNKELVKQLSGKNYFNTQYAMEFMCDAFGYEVLTKELADSYKERVLDIEENVRDYAF